MARLPNDEIFRGVYKGWTGCVMQEESPFEISVFLFPVVPSNNPFYFRVSHAPSKDLSQPQFLEAFLRLEVRQDQRSPILSYELSEQPG